MKNNDEHRHYGDRTILETIAEQQDDEVIYSEKTKKERIFVFILLNIDDSIFNEYAEYSEKFP